MYLVVDGRGTTEVWGEGNGKKLTFEWQRGLAVLDSAQRLAPHRECDVEPGAFARRNDGAEHDQHGLELGFIFNCPYTVKDRFDASEDYYKYKEDVTPDPVRGLAMRQTNIIPDIIGCELPLDNRRSPGYPPHRAAHDRATAFISGSASTRTAATPRRTRTARPRCSSA
jgi:hypothetical protein